MRPIDIAAVLTVILLWGGNFVALKYGLEHFPPFFLTALRFVLVSLLLLPYCLHTPLPQGRLLFQVSVLNTLHFSLPYVGLAMGLSIASTAIICQLGVPFACLLSALFMGDRLGPWRSLGMIISFGGMFIVFGAPNVLEHKTAFFIALAGAFFWGASTVAMKRVTGIRMMPLIAWTSLLSVPQLLLISFIVEPGAWQLLASTPLEAGLGIVYSAAISTVIAHAIWYHLLRHHPVSSVTPFSLLTPIFSALLGFLIFGEVVSSYVISGGLVALVGVLIIVVRRPKLAAPLNKLV